MKAGWTKQTSYALAACLAVSGFLSYEVNAQTQPAAPDPHAQHQAQAAAADASLADQISKLTEKVAQLESALQQRRQPMSQRMPGGPRPMTPRAGRPMGPPMSGMNMPPGGSSGAMGMMDDDMMMGGMGGGGAMPGMQRRVRQSPGARRRSDTGVERVP